mgnify:CR=1 FL=1
MLVIGTAGHVDHGKTSLVEALTGIQTDRLKEEQARGISIELGFAHLTLDGHRYGIVDVPGHERFLRQMIAGATGIDLVMLVIAADEGVMPQTREHLDVCRLLGLRHGFVVLSKVDLAGDDDWLALVHEDIADFVRGTFLEGAPVVPYSRVRPDTHAAVVSELLRVAREAGAGRLRAAQRPFRLPIDRVFSLRGFGTVVTGTVASGSLAAGEAVALMPSGRAARVRGLESHGEAVQEVTAGQRAAVNLQGVEKDDVDRGEVLARTGSLEASHLLDIDLHLLPHVSKLLETRAKALVHLGTAQVTGTVVLLDSDAMEPGETRPAQLRLDAAVAAVAGDAVVLRGFEALEHHGTTFGGGSVIHPRPKKHSAGDKTVLACLAALRDGELPERVRAALELEGIGGLDARALAQITGATTDEVTAAARALGVADAAFEVTIDGTALFVPAGPFEALLERTLRIIRDYHDRHPQRAGIPRGELRSQVGTSLPARLFGELVAVLERRGAISPADKSVRLAAHVPRLSKALGLARDGVIAALDAGVYATPFAEEIAMALAPKGVPLADVVEVVDLLLEEGLIVRLEGGLLFHRRHIDALVARVTACLAERGELTTADLKEFTQTSRKYFVPLGEHLDALRVTARVGDVRRGRF